MRNIRSSRKFYSEGNAIEYPIGKYYQFDESGVLIRTTDFDKLFKFNYRDVQRLFKKKKYTITLIKGIDAATDEVNWDVFYKDQKKQTCHMVINGKTGQIISDNHGLTFIE